MAWRARREPRRGGYQGGKPAAEVGLPTPLPSWSIRGASPSEQGRPEVSDAPKDETKDEKTPRWVILGEHGPEIVVLPVGTLIIPNEGAK